MRIDHAVMQEWVTAGSRVLDLGCGDGSLLKHLKQTKQIQGYGVEINSDDILRCVSNQVNVIEQNVDEDLSNFTDKSFDTVIMSQAIQALLHPDKALEEMLRIGKQCIVTFPNFGHWKARWHLAFEGRMPVSDLLPYEWYNTPNIHFCTFRDFEILCKSMRIEILNRQVISSKYFSSLLNRLHPNLFGETALYRLTKN